MLREIIIQNCFCIGTVFFELCLKNKEILVFAFFYSSKIMEVVIFKNLTYLEVECF